MSDNKRVSHSQLEGTSSIDDHTMMTSSYHEICDEDAAKEAGEGELTQSLPIQGARRLLDRARNWVGDLSLEGVVSQEGQQVTYVTQDLTSKIISSPSKETVNTSLREDNNSSYNPQDSTAVSDLNVVVNEMEIEAKRLASSIDTLTESLTGILHSLSTMTLDCVFTAVDGVTQLCDTADASIKVMYQVMAKCEELNKAVQPLYQLQQQIKETKRLLDKVEAEIN